MTEKVEVTFHVDAGSVPQGERDTHMCPMAQHIRKTLIGQTDKMVEVYCETKSDKPGEEAEPYHCHCVLMGHN
jgi:hypothetical protein